ncbi:hypothetical protein ACWPKS_01580 [Coraliomargarita sp. W4R72]
MPLIRSLFFILTATLCLLCGGFIASCSFGSGPVVHHLQAVDYGLVADGLTDDGAALARLIEVAASLDGTKRIIFPKDATIYVATGIERYALRLDAIDHLFIDGNGSTFYLHDDVRFLLATECRDLELTSFNVTMANLPSTPATVTGVSESGRALEVVLDDPSRAGELGGPTRLDGEQDFFGMLWIEGKNAPETHHYYVARVEASEAGNLVVQSTKPLPAKWLEEVASGKMRISLPIPGVAHRRGPGALLRIDRCNGVRMSQVEVWSAPWFAFEIVRNDGLLEFLEVNIRPRLGSGQITSSMRDGFHVKANRGPIRFEDCIILGTNDDAFNISTHAWRVVNVLAPNQIQVRQIFPIQYMPMRIGGELLILDPTGTRRLASVGVANLEVTLEEHTFSLSEHPAPTVVLTLNEEIDGLEKGSILWDVTSANPDTVIRRCLIGNSCRFQSPVTLEDSDSLALLYFYSEEVEGPMPSGSRLINNRLRQGRGNDDHAVVFYGWRAEAPEILPSSEEFPLQNILIKGNTIYGNIFINGVVDYQLEDNDFKNGRLIEVNVKSE